MDQPVHILVLEDNAADAELVQRELRKAGLDFTATCAADRHAFVAALAERPPDLLLADYSLPGFDGLSAMRLARQQYPDLPTIIVSGIVHDEAAIEALTSGATDYVLKDRLARLRPVVQRAIQEQRQLRERNAAEQRLKMQAHYDRLRADAAEVLQRPGEARPLLQAVTALLVERLDAAFARVWTLDATGRTLELQASAGLYTHIDGPHSRIAVGQYKIGLIARERRPHVTNQVIGDPQVHDQDWARRQGLAAFAGFPLLLEGRLLGVIALFARHELAPQAVDACGAVAHLLAQVLGRKQAEDELHAAHVSAERARAAAEEANRAKDHFLAVLSHELRTPLMPVLATAAMLERDPTLSPDVRESVEVIRRNVELEARLIDDLLDVTRIARGKLELNRRPIEVCTVMGRAVEVCRPDIEARRLHFGADVVNGPHMVNADPGRLQQVFWNLIKNAVKFTPPGGCVGFRCWRQADQVRVEVSDSGEGIAPDVLPRIFNAFEQGEPLTARKFGGLGLGLAISRAIVEMHGGAITAASRGKGQGATFTVTLPVHVVEAPAAAPSGAAGAVPTQPAHPSGATAQPARAGPGRGLRVLLVEDHGDTAHVLTRLLAASGHKVHSAGDVTTALQHARTQPFDLLISDLGLPDGSGIDLLGQLRADGHNFPAIALTGYGQEEDLARTRAAGFAAHVVKPVDFELLERAVAAAVPGQPAAAG
ncbi:MAG: response regulator [Planctomycetota bacterium]